MIFSMSSKLKHPAAHSAVASPRERPANAAARFTFSSPSSSLNFSRAAMSATNIAGMHKLRVDRTFQSDLVQNSRTSQPKISLAFSSMSFTAGRSFTDSIMPTACEPCPGNMRTIDIGGSPFGPTLRGGRGLAFSPDSMFFMVLKRVASTRFIMALSCFEGPSSQNSVAPSEIISCRDLSQRTVSVSCRFSRGITSLGSHPGRSGSAVTFMYIRCLGDFSFGFSSSSAFASGSTAESIRGVWNAPDALRSFACIAPAFSAIVFRVSRVFSCPPTEKPSVKSEMAIWATPPVLFIASLQRSFTFASLRPTTESMPCLLSWVALSMISPRSFTSFKPSSKDTMPEAQRAVYSPREKPATAAARFTASSSSTRSCSSAARPAINIAGWQYCVSASFSSVDSSQNSSTSQPRMDDAFSSMSFTAGKSFTPASIFAY
mmetsp:Transcript_107865/g.336420  ORF Transcript_107865/g.336420 Transcript_107865/m.336420 type:complete len:432 (-) Transcript_107865:192-1487(-)